MYHNRGSKLKPVFNKTRKRVQYCCTGQQIIEPNCYLFVLFHSGVGKTDGFDDLERKTYTIYLSFEFVSRVSCGLRVGEGQSNVVEVD